MPVDFKNKYFVLRLAIGLFLAVFSLLYVYAVFSLFFSEDSISPSELLDILIYLSVIMSGISAMFEYSNKQMIVLTRFLAGFLLAIGVPVMAILQFIFPQMPLEANLIIWPLSFIAGCLIIQQSYRMHKALGNEGVDLSFSSGKVQK